MSKIKTILSLGLAAVMFTGCSYIIRDNNSAECRYTIYKTNLRIDKTAHPQVIEKQLTGIGQTIVRVFKEEYHNADYSFFGKDLVLRGTKNYGYNEVPECQFNISSVCDAYRKGYDYLSYFDIIGEKLILPLRDGSVTSCSMSRCSAEYLQNLLQNFSEYNNQDNCKLLTEHLINNYLPSGQKR